MTRRLPFRAARLNLFALALLLTGCFEQPVTESMYLKFLPGDAAVVGVTVSLADTGQFKDNPAVLERIEAFRRDLLEGRDAWARRLDAVEPVMDRTLWDRNEEVLVRVTRRAAFEPQERVGRFFADTLIEAHLTVREEERELDLVPGAGGRASRAQRDQFRQRFNTWLEAYARYLSETATLYSYLQQNPSRAEACFGQIFEGSGGNEDQPPPEATAEEKALSESVRKGMDEMLELFSVSSDSVHSLEELSRLVHDPFPAPLTVQTPGPVLEVEGFEQHGRDLVSVPGLSLWQALLTLEERWISPNPVVARYRQLAKEIKLDIVDFARRPRRVSEPSPAEIRQALEETLSPAQNYRVRWSTRDLSDQHLPERLEEIWTDPAP